ncbi:alginate lyase family protein [Desulfoprunum benzoelyticum]|uniref:heparinase II/III domain-containing protein n=1 Tax=Desulfoprunum benzoelyticum TaxID=1506996 RepID=UPI0019647436|nr:alginate lyase family protein [Desulfoprunum benzoelyticum]
MFRLRQALWARIGHWERRTPRGGWGGEMPAVVGKFWQGQWQSDLSGRAGEILAGVHTFFSRHHLRVGESPDWFANPFNENDTVPAAMRTAHWSQIPDFAAGDIKGLWELSRFGWVYPLAAAAAAGAETRAEACFWRLVEDWAVHNPPNVGAQWKCGQEIAIRMFALVSAYYAFGGHVDAGGKRQQLLAAMVFESARRIEANIDYALSQNNNHGISEAAGLFTAGVFFGEEKWITRGRGLLERQALDLIYEDGSFSQHSVNYHRVMLHVYLWAIQLGRANGIEFSPAMLDRVRRAGNWLAALCDHSTGRCPNLGANDGALIFPVTDCDYLDFRPTIQATGMVVEGRPWLPQGPWDGLAGFLGVPVTAQAAAADPAATVPRFWHFRHGGYAVFRNGPMALVFRCPEFFRHRPGQCDLMHVDLSIDGLNLLRDGGSYSYNCAPPWQEYFSSVAGHNTVQFDDHDQMPRLSRFLYGHWPELAVAVDEQAPMVKAGFTDWRGCRHQREVRGGARGYRVTDRIGGFREKAVLRWRLGPELEWKLDGLVCASSRMTLRIATDVEPVAVRIVQGWESLYYQERTPIPVLEIEVGPDCRQLTTEILI